MARFSPYCGVHTTLCMMKKLNALDRFFKLTDCQEMVPWYSIKPPEGPLVLNVGCNSDIIGRYACLTTRAQLSLHEIASGHQCKRHNEYRLLFIPCGFWNMKVNLFFGIKNLFLDFYLLDRHLRQSVHTLIIL